MTSAKQDQDREHGKIMKELAEQFRPVFESSPMGVYLYLDDTHKICNEHLARMFGISAEEWAKTGSFLDAYVDPRDQKLFAANYQHHIAKLTHPITFKFLARRKDGTSFMAETDMIPISWHGMPVAYHFVREAR